jgi:hypothetical protein
VSTRTFTGIFLGKSRLTSTSKAAIGVAAVAAIGTFVNALFEGLHERSRWKLEVSEAEKDRQHDRDKWAHKTAEAEKARQREKSKWEQESCQKSG